MIKWILLGAFFYMVYKMLGPMLAIFKFSRKINEKKQKETRHSKVLKMDIQDAEFEDDLD